jgi:hypothetical protein
MGPQSNGRTKNPLLFMLPIPLSCWTIMVPKTGKILAAAEEDTMF